MNDSQYRRAKFIQDQITKIDRILDFFHSDERRILEIATSDDFTHSEPEIYEHLSVPRKYQMNLNQMLLDYKAELENEFEEL